MAESENERSTARGFQVGGDRNDLFRGTAWYYRRYRRAYPAKVVERMIAKFGLDGRGRLLDIGCGTGQVFEGLAPRFEEVVAIDADPEMAAAAQETAFEAKLAHVSVHMGRGEEVVPQMGTFRMATFGASFHWMDRAAVADRVYDLLDQRGALVALAYTGIHEEKTDWEAVVCRTLETWLGPQRRAGGGVYQEGERHEAVLSKTRFGNAEVEHFHVEESWPIDEIVGFLYSTSYASQTVLGDKAAAFEHDLRQRLRQLEPGGQFRKEVEYTLIFATK